MITKICRTCKTRPAIKSRFENYGALTCIECRRAPKLRPSQGITKNFKDPEAQPYKRKKDVPPRYVKKRPVPVPQVLAPSEAKPSRASTSSTKLATPEERIAARKERQRRYNLTKNGKAAKRRWLDKNREEEKVRCRRYYENAKADPVCKAKFDARVARYKASLKGQKAKREAAARYYARHREERLAKDKAYRQTEEAKIKRRKAAKLRRQKRKAAKILDEILAPTRRT